MRQHGVSQLRQTGAAGDGCGDFGIRQLQARILKLGSVAPQGAAQLINQGFLGIYLVVGCQEQKIAINKSFFDFWCRQSQCVTYRLLCER